MNIGTLREYQGLAIDWPNRPQNQTLSLTSEEKTAYDFLLANNLRLEQERIPHRKVVASLKTGASPSQES